MLAHNTKLSIDDGTSGESVRIDTQKNILKDFVRDISTKVSSARKAIAKPGKFMTTTALYGYLNDPTNHNHLIIDEETAPIVKLIFEMYCQGC